MASGGDKPLIEQLSHSAVYRDYERAFSTANPNLRISEVAYEVRFQSFTHFTGNPRAANDN
jgi:hypothetical protein